MHFTKAVLLFAGITAAAPTVASTGSVASSNSATQATAAASLSSTVLGDLTAWYYSIDDTLAALSAFTGGPNAAAQGLAVATAGDDLLRTTSQLVSDGGKLSSYGPISASDSARYTDLIVNHIAGNFIHVFELIGSKKTLFAQLGVASEIAKGVNGLATLFLQLRDVEASLLTTADMDKVHNAAVNIFAAGQSALQAYMS